MRRPSVNFLVDAAAFLAFVGLTSTGVLMHYHLPPGTGGTRAIWSLGRHDWGSVHFWMAVAFLALLALHLFLHWKWIYAVVRGRTRLEGTNPQPRIALGAIALLAVLALAVAPLISPIQTIEGGSEHGGGGGGRERHAAGEPETGASITSTEDAVATTQPGAPGEGVEPGHTGEAPTIRGTLTLREVEEMTGVPASYIIEQLKLPADTSPEERLGPLHQRLGFEMEDVRQAVERYQTEKAR